MYLHKRQQEKLYICVKRKTGEKYGLATGWITDSSDQVHQKKLMYSMHFHFTFTCRTNLQESQAPRSSENWHKEQKPWGGWGLCQGTFKHIYKLTGLDGLHLSGAEGVGKHQCKMTLNYLWKLTATWEDSWWPEQSKSGQLQVSLPCSDPWQGDGETNLGKHFLYLG